MARWYKESARELLARGVGELLQDNNTQDMHPINIDALIIYEALSSAHVKCMSCELVQCEGINISQIAEAAATFKRRCYSWRHTMRNSRSSEVLMMERCKTIRGILSSPSAIMNGKPL
jgi:hypothetical protein